MKSLLRFFVCILLVLTLFSSVASAKVEENVIMYIYQLMSAAQFEKMDVAVPVVTSDSVGISVDGVSEIIMFDPESMLITEIMFTLKGDRSTEAGCLVLGAFDLLPSLMEIEAKIGKSPAQKGEERIAAFFDAYTKNPDAPYNDGDFSYSLETVKGENLLFVKVLGDN